MPPKAIWIAGMIAQVLLLLRCPSGPGMFFLRPWLVVGIVQPAAFLFAARFYTRVWVATSLILILLLALTTAETWRALARHHVRASSFGQWLVAVALVTATVASSLGLGHEMAGARSWRDATPAIVRWIVLERRWIEGVLAILLLIGMGVFSFFRWRAAPNLTLQGRMLAAFLLITAAGDAVANLSQGTLTWTVNVVCALGTTVLFLAWALLLRHDGNEPESGATLSPGEIGRLATEEDRLTRAMRRASRLR